MSKSKLQKLTRLKTLSCATIIGVALASTPALAQASDEGAIDDDNVIVVTAQFREQNLQDTPLAITAVTSDMLEARSQTNLSEVANQAPSVSLTPQTASFGPSITATIRGLGQIDFNPLVEPGVGIYIDDVYFPRLVGANFELLDVERVEILRGPQGTLTGRNSEGGAIRYISKRPDGTFGGFAEATYGSRDEVKLRGAIQFPLGDDLSARVSGSYGKQDGYVQGFDYGCLFPASGVPVMPEADGECKTADFGDVNYHAFRGVLRYNPSDSVDIMLIGDYTHDSTYQLGEVLLYGENGNPNVTTENGLPLSADFICGRYCNYVDFGYSADNFVAGIIPPLNGLPLAASEIDNRSLFESYGFSVNAEFKITDFLNLTSISAYRHFNSTFSNDSDASPARINATIVGLDSDFYSQELRFNVEVSDALEMTVGGYYGLEDTLQDTLTDIRYVAAGNLPIFPLQFLGGGPVEVESMAVFSTAFIRPVDDLTITLGGRYTDETKETTYRRTNYDGVTPNPFVDGIGAVYGAGYNGPDTLDANNNGDVTEIVAALNGLRSKFKGKRFDYRASVDYRISDEVLVYLTSSTGFKGGGISPRPFNQAQAVGFDEEDMTSYEIGLKTDLFDRRLRVNLSAYMNKYKDAQISLLSCPQFGGPGPCALPQNAGNATIKGLEAELSTSPFEGFDLNASFSYLNWNWDCVKIQTVRALLPGESADTCSTDTAIVSQLDSPPRGVVEWQWSVGAQYRIDLGNMGSLTPRVDVSYNGNMTGGGRAKAAAGSPTDLFGTIPAYTLTNGRVSYRTENEDIEVSLAVTNMFNKYYFYQKFDLTQAGAGLITGAPARPREWALSVKKKF